VTFSFSGQLSLFAHAVLRVLQDFLIGGSFANYLDQNFSTSWLRRCLWLSFSPTVYGNGFDFVSADTLRFCAFVRTIFLQRSPVRSSFSRQGLFFIFASACCFGGSQFLLASLYPDLLIDMSSSYASIASVSTLHQFRGGRVSKLLRSAIAESFSQFTKNVLLRRSDRMYCTRRVPSIMYREYHVQSYKSTSSKSLKSCLFHIPFHHKSNAVVDTS
jgi:hypothetical protein